MRYCPTTEQELLELTGSEVRCLEYLINLRWPKGVVCPSCNKRPGTLGSGYRCRNCPREFRVTTGTIFEGSRIALRDWFTLIWRMVYSSRLHSAAGFRREMFAHAPVSTVAAWRCQQKLRKLMYPPKEILSGNFEFRVIELPIRGRSMVNALLLVERRYNRRGVIGIQRVVDHSPSGLKMLLIELVDPESSVLYAKNWNGYESLKSAGYVLKPAGKDKLIRTERTYLELLEFLHKNHRGGVSQRAIDGYLNEFTFRFNARRSATPGHIFRTLLERAVCAKAA